MPRESVGGRLAQRGRAVLSAVHLLAVLGLTDALHQLVEREVERGVLVARAGLGAHDRAGADQGQFDAIVAAGSVGLVMAAAA